MKKLQSLLNNLVVGPLLLAGCFVLVCSGCEQAGPPKAAAKDAVERLKPDATAVVGGELAQAPQSEAIALPPLGPEVLTLIEKYQNEELHERIYYVTNATMASTQKAQALFFMFETLDSAGQRSVAHAAVRFVDDQHYPMVRERLLNSKFDPAVLSVFMTDTLRRKNQVRIPALHALANLEGHPMQAEATELLPAFLGSAYVGDSVRRGEIILAWLEKNPN